MWDAHLQVDAKTLDFEIAKVDALGAVRAAKNNTDGVSQMARACQGKISHAVAHPMARAIVKGDGGSAGASVSRE